MNELISKQLNDPTSGNFIRVDRIDFEENRVVCSKYETIIYDEAGNVRRSILIEQFSYVFETIVLLSHINKETVYSDLILEALKVELFNDYEIKDSIYNWLFPTKRYRISINNARSNKEIIINKAYRDLMNSKIDLHNATMITQATNTIMYVTSIEEGDVTVIQDFINDWIFIEELLTVEPDVMPSNTNMIS